MSPQRQMPSSRLALLLIAGGSTGVEEKISMDCVLIDESNAAALETFQLVE